MDNGMNFINHIPYKRRVLKHKEGAVSSDLEIVKYDQKISDCRKCSLCLVYEKKQLPLKTATICLVKRVAVFGF
jgi:hypothetical protein